MIKKVPSEVFFNHPVPEQTDTYTPVTNIMLDNLIRSEAAKRNYTITGVGYRANSISTEFISMFTLDQPEQGLSRMIGYRNSTNKKLAVGFVAGALVMICANGMITGDIITFRKHTGEVEEPLLKLVSHSFDEITPRFNHLQNEVSLLKDTLIERDVAFSLISDLFFSEKLLSSTQMSILKESLFTDKNFSLPKGNKDLFPAWNLYNQVTNAMKHGAPANLFQQHIDLHKYVFTYLNLNNNVEETVEILSETQEPDNN